MTLSFPTGRSSVLGRSLDEDVGGAGVGRGRLNDGRRHPGPLPGLPGDLGEGVAAEPGDEADPGAQPPGGHALVRALAARPQHELPAAPGLADPRPPQGAVGGHGDETPEARGVGSERGRERDSRRAPSESTHKKDMYTSLHYQTAQ